MRPIATHSVTTGERRMAPTPPRMSGRQTTSWTRKITTAAASVVALSTLHGSPPVTFAFNTLTPRHHSYGVALRTVPLFDGGCGRGAGVGAQCNQLARSSSLGISRGSRGKSDLRMSAAAVGTTITAIAGACTGGFMAGGLHAIAGPDHLAALIPRCCGQRWYNAGRTGLLWGMGHGLSATILGITAFALKNRLSASSRFLTKVLHGASSALEIAVGVSLVVIGLLGIKEAREWDEEEAALVAGGQSLSAAAAEPVPETGLQKRAVIFNGLLHGFSWDGAPSLLPALAVATWRGNVTFLLAYALGTMVTMAVATTLVGEGTRQAGKLFNRPDIPQKLSLVSSAIAILIGLFWVGIALFK